MTTGRAHPIPLEEDNEGRKCVHLGPNGELCPLVCLLGSVFCYNHAYAYGEDTENDESESNNNKEIESAPVSIVPDNRTPFTYNEFLTMWSNMESMFGEDANEVENSRKVRGANRRVSKQDTNGQLKAQYGRLLPKAVKFLFETVLGLSREDVFVDIGHGIGNAPAQAALTFGCKARGIEVVSGRHAVAMVYSDQLLAQAGRRVNTKNDRIFGTIDLRHGCLADPKHREFLTQGVTKAYFNNFNDVFSERSSKKGNQTYYLDDFAAALFALMQPGATIATLAPLRLGPTRDEVNKLRKNRGLAQSDNASFFKVERVLLGKACDSVKWTKLSGNVDYIEVYKYTRLEQETPNHQAVFLCCNTSCECAKNNTPIPATKVIEDGKVVLNHCECKVSAPNLRRRNTRKRKTCGD